MSYGQLNICIYRSIDIVSLSGNQVASWAFISIEQFVQPKFVARRACISIEQFVQPKFVAGRVGSQKYGNIVKNCSFSIDMNALRAIAYCGDPISIDMNALRVIAAISHREIMSIERKRCMYCFVRRTLTTKSERKYFNNALN
jgi:hypothetical protein